MNLKICNKGDNEEKSNPYFPGQACKCNFYIIPSILVFTLCIKTEKLKPSVSILIRLSLSEWYLFGLKK